MTYNVSSTNLLNKYTHPTTNSAQNGSKQQNKTYASIFYINDLHGKMTNMERLYAIAQQFDSFQPSYQTDKLKLASGDIILGENILANKVAHNFMNWAGFSATALGNHELDVIPPKLSEFMQTAKYKLLGANVTVDKGTPMDGKITKSFIEEHNGNKYGIIGIAPSDMLDRVKHNESVEEIHVSDLESTIKSVQEEIDKLKSQGINKIILLSHSGYENDKKIAQSTSGLDVILGAHTHNILENVKEGVNLLTSKDGEPVLITQAGKDGEKWNQTFHKSFKTVKDTPIETLVAQQIIHYFTTYGLENLGLYNEDLVYIPHEQLDVPELEEDIPVIMLHYMTYDMIAEKLMTLLTSGIALSQETLDLVKALSDYIPKDRFDEIKNKEFKIYLYDKYNIVPSNPKEFLRYIIYKLTGETLIVNNRKLRKLIQTSDKDETLRLLNTYLKHNQILSLLLKHLDHLYLLQKYNLYKSE